MGDIREELQELGNMAIKLQQDIEVLQKERSGLQNEIASARENYKKNLDIEYAGMKAALQAKYDQLLAEERDKIDQVGEKLKEASIIHEQNKEILAQSNENIKYLEGRSQDIERKLSSADIEISGIKAQLAEKSQVLDRAMDENTQLKALLLSKKVELDNREFQIAQENQKMELLRENVSALLMQDTAAIDAANQQRGILKKEGEEILAIYSKVKVEKEELQKLQALKDDIVKLEALQKVANEKQVKLDETGKALAQRSDAVLEREKTASERDRLLNIKDKEISGKIDTLNRLREALAKNA